MGCGPKLANLWSSVTSCYIIVSENPQSENKYCTSLPRMPTIWSKLSVFSELGYFKSKQTCCSWKTSRNPNVYFEWSYTSFNDTDYWIGYIIYICPIIIQHSKMIVIHENLRDLYSHDAFVTCETAMIALPTSVTICLSIFSLGTSPPRHHQLSLTAQYFMWSPHTTHDSRQVFNFGGWIITDF